MDSMASSQGSCVDIATEAFFAVQETLPVCRSFANGLLPAPNILSRAEKTHAAGIMIYKVGTTGSRMGATYGTCRLYLGLLDSNNCSVWRSTVPPA